MKDYNYSDIVGRIQNNREAGLQELKEVVGEIQFADSRIATLERELNQERLNKKHLEAGIGHIAKHLKISFPFGLLTDSVVVNIESPEKMQVIQLVNLPAK